MNMDDEIRAHLQHVFALLGEVFNRMEMVVVSDGGKESKLAIIDEIATSQDHINTAEALLEKK
jgi:predicted S18 family serine protease